MEPLGGKFQGQKSRKYCLFFLKFGNEFRNSFVAYFDTCPKIIFSMEDDLQLQIYLERKRMLELELKEG